MTLSADPSPAAGQPIPDQPIPDQADRLAALSDRIRALAETTGDEALRAQTARAGQLLDDARERAESTRREELERVRTRLHTEAQRSLQNARLDARARLAAFRWSQLTAALDEATQALTRIRERDPRRYTAALVRWFEQARAQLPPGPLQVRANVDDLERLRTALEPDAAEWAATDLTDGLVVGTPDGTVVCDQTRTRRSSRRASELRLAAADILFDGNDDGPEGPDLT